MKKVRRTTPQREAPRSTWLYCVVRAGRRPAVPRAAGIPGASPLRVLDAGEGLWLVVADVSRDAWSAEAIESRLADLDWLGAVALGHEAVVERFVAAEALLPAKLFTIFLDDGRAVEHVQRDRRRIVKALGRIAGRVELGVRVAFDESKALRKAEAESRRLSRGTGAGFLLRKKKVQEAARSGGEAAVARARSLHRKLSARAVDAVQKDVVAADGSTSRLVLDAAYLVDARRAAAFRKAVRTLARDAERASLSVEVTGPWPAYHFAGASAAGGAAR